MSNDVAHVSASESNDIAHEFYTTEELEMIRRVRDMSGGKTHVELPVEEWARLYSGLQGHHRFIRSDTPYHERRHFHFCGVDWLMKIPDEA